MKRTLELIVLERLLPSESGYSVIIVDILLTTQTRSFDTIQFCDNYMVDFPHNRNKENDREWLKGTDLFFGNLKVKYNNKRQ